jgi:cardiolipin synthase
MHMPQPTLQRLASIGAAICIVCAASCASLPDTQAILERHEAQAVRFENARGPVSVLKSAAILDELKRRSGDIDILEKQIALEQAINDSPLTLGNKATLLQDGPATYAAMFKAIGLAQDNINLESYIIEDDAVGREFSELLLAQQRRGIQVNLIYDSVGGLNTPKVFYDRLKQAGVAVLEFNPVNPLAARGPWLINNRDHRKLLIVDGHTAFIGGINISSVYSSGSIVRRATNKARLNSSTWRDTDLQVEGPVVAEFQKLFLQTWDKQHGKPLATKNYFPPLKPLGNDIIRTIGSTPDDPYSLIYLTLMSAIGNAEKQVYLTNAYFVPDPQLLKTLTEAAGRGVDVKLILPSYSDSDLVFHAGRTHYASLLAGGVHIYKRTGALLHSKTAVIDGVWSTVGSTNLDWRSFMDNDEINAVILGRDFAAQMTAMFAKDLAASQAIDQKTWQDRPPQFKLKEWLAQLLERWL